MRVSMFCEFINGKNDRRIFSGIPALKFWQFLGVQQRKKLQSFSGLVSKTTAALFPENHFTAAIIPINILFYGYFDSR